MNAYDGMKKTGKEYLIDPEVMKEMICPLSRASLFWDPLHGQLVSRAAKLAYPIRDGVVVMLPSEALSLEEEHF